MQQFLLLGIPGGRESFVYLLDMDFRRMVDQAAPLVSPLSGQVGELTLVQDDGEFSISGGKFIIPAQTTPVWGDLGAYGEARTRAAGLVLLGTLNLSTWEEIGLAWHTAEAVVDPDDAEHAIQANTTDGTLERVDGMVIVTGLSLSTDYPIALMLRNLGASLWIRISGAWKILWIDAIGGTTTLYSMLANLDGVGSLDKWRVARFPGQPTDAVPGNGVAQAGCRDLDLCTPGTGSGTSSIAVPAVGNTFVHTADSLIKWTQTTVPAANAQQIGIRGTTFAIADFWLIQVFSTGVLDLWEGTGAGYTKRGEWSGPIVNGDVIEVKALGNTINLYVNGAVQISYTAATAWGSQTAGKLMTLGTGGAIANLTARTLDGAANVGSGNHPGYGLATACLPGPCAALDTFTHEADFVAEYTIDALPSAGSIAVFFRIAAANTYENIYLLSTGNLVLEETLAGVATTCASTGAGGVSSGDRITIIGDGASLKAYVNTALGWSYASAAILTATTGKINSISDGRISNLIAYPRNLDAAPLTPGAAAIKSALERMAQ